MSNDQKQMAGDDRGGGDRRLRLGHHQGRFGRRNTDGAWVLGQYAGTGSALREKAKSQRAVSRK